MEEVPKMQVFVTCPVCRKEVELDKSLEITSGINICYDCAHMPREKKIEILLFRLLTEKEASQGGGRFKGQVERARKRSGILQNLEEIKTLVQNIEVYCDSKKRDNLPPNTVVIKSLVHTILTNIEKIKKEV